MHVFFFFIKAAETGTTVDIPVCKNKEFNLVAKFPTDVDHIYNNGTELQKALTELKGSCLFI